MRVLVLTSCTGEKRFKPEGQLTPDDFLIEGTADFIRREEQLAQYRMRAEELYSGQQHVRLMRGVEGYRRARGCENLDLWILSAGYGLISGYREIVPYECTFQGMKSKELLLWSNRLGIPEDVRKVLSTPYDIGLVLLGDSYLKACQLTNDLQLGGSTLIFCGSRLAARLPQIANSKTVVLANSEAKRFSCGLVGLKGEIAARLLQIISDGTHDDVLKLLDPSLDLLSFLEGIRKAQNPLRDQLLLGTRVDYVIQIPESWWQKPHREKLVYFIPEWDDLVDPDFDFETDTHSGGSGDWSNQVYAHQMYPEPNYDGILVSKVIAEQSRKKRERINALGVHRFLRVPREFPIMGDCGAFGYIQQEVPPYSTEEILDYYTRLDFDYGVSVDHLIVAATEEQKKFRYELTIHNAEEFLTEHKKQGLNWEPIGAVQGWDPKSYAEAARNYAAMGYRYIALGGLVRSTTKEILRILKEVQQAIPTGMKLHLFGLARLQAIPDFHRWGVTSVDSASYLRQAWMRTAQSYLLDSTAYAALRIPEAGKSYRAKRMTEHAGLSEDDICKLEQDALRAVRALARNECSVDSCLNALLEYDRLITSERTDMTALYRRTLTERPWEQCDCALCKACGIEVIIFRGNNRNRRRGFHNTYIFYRLMQRMLAGEDIRSASAGSPYIQTTLFG